MPRIVVVNNDTDFLTLMGDLLETRGWEAVVCREGRSAVPIIKREMPDLVILDIRMEAPESGWTILELLTLDPMTRDLPVIVCSAAVQELQAREPWLNSHGISILPKPFDIDDLYSRVEEGLYRRA